MSNRVSRALNGAVGRVLPERRIFIRSQARTSYMHLTPVAQAGFVVLMIGAACWAGYATIVTVSGSARMEEMRLTQGAVERAWSAQIKQMQSEQAALTAHLAQAETERAEAAEALSRAKAELVEAEALIAALGVERTALEQSLERLQLERARAAERVARLEAAITDSGFAPREPGAARANGGALIGAEPGPMLTSAMAVVIAERNEARANLAALDREMASLTEKMDQWRDRQARLLERVEAAASAGLDGLGSVLERAGLDVDDILAETRAAYGGAGGPFEPLSDREAARLDPDGEDMRVAALVSDLERVNLLRVAIDRLPFGLPVRGARLTSAFGKRRDPFRRHWAMHNGVDYAAPIGTPILSTAKGVVSFAGRMRGYGNVVIIKHSFGYETRYAHLNKSLVKVGDQVSRGMRIALMGNTGRSSGSHLHYEIRIDDDPVNPKKFIEATRDVL
ncbi:MAG: DUF5930 domain-containing protein [Pikeienuella sp.]